ncbi:hypothetical protein L207DRAFT_623420 [Hyaloscypha variabilis F]|uniref:Ubiquitin-like protease family profile domain-containing protein n=1 Tax=Hyaloscypha variabilis (strain UAMH 11265 / GT02V1 / F) TaxID=1149755 RepID=A0A2J6RRV6_HYAVF|nr:hypothetical protein L207DRAFT_623420 [Hyaloscypha variabilis F]
MSSQNPPPARTIGRVLKRSDLTTDEQAKISRVQFKPLTGRPKQLWEHWSRLMAHSFEDDAAVMKVLWDTPFLKKVPAELTWLDIAFICYTKISEEATQAQGHVDDPQISKNVVYSYIRMICRYVNDVRLKSRKEEAQNQQQEKFPVSCGLVNRSLIQKLSGKVPDTEEELTAGIPSPGDWPKEDMLQNDYIFAPSLDKTGFHFALMGIAPKQKFIFTMDSVAYDPRYNKWEFPSQKLYNLLLFLLPGNLDDKNNEVEANWNVFGQWAERGLSKRDESPNCCRQRDGYNCAVFTMTNAMCLAFGFELLSYSVEDFEDGKRPRIAAEFDNDGFGGDFASDMFDLPTGRADRVGTAPPTRADSPASPVEETVHAIGNPLKRKHLTRPQPGKAGDGRIRSAAEAWAYEQQLPEDLKPKPRLPEAYPPQFDSKIFSQAGFLYAIPESINFDTKKDYSLEELKDACELFPLVGWAEWSTKPKKIFTLWMLNEMGAFMSRARGDPLLPMEGLALGFDEWKKEQDAANGPKRSPRKCRKVVVSEGNPSL